MNLARELGKRVVGLALVLFLVTLFTAFLLELAPGDPVDTLLPVADENSTFVQERKADVRERLNLDKPFYERYGLWVGDFVHGDFGDYFRVTDNEPVSNHVKDAFPVSLQLIVYSQILALAIAVPLGVMTAYRAGSRFDRGTNAAAFGLLSLPNFVLGLVLAYYVGVWLGWLPTQGYTDFGENPVEHFRHMALPTITLAASQIAVYMRLLRSDMVATLQEDFIQMARSKGISDRRVLWRHALRPSSLTVLTVAGLNVGALIGGAVIVEVIFQLPGLGYELAQAIFQRQYVALQSFVAIIAIVYVLVNFTVDVLYTIIDPRIRHARAS
ncbi:MAG TPA: ABC transporter permease [Acidimicrobiales bacterium]|jgi:peptide/nickel transport system permease protein